MDQKDLIENLSILKIVEFSLIVLFVLFVAYQAGRWFGEFYFNISGKL